MHNYVANLSTGLSLFIRHVCMEISDPALENRAYAHTTFNKFDFKFLSQHEIFAINAANN